MQSKNKPKFDLQKAINATLGEVIKERFVVEEYIPSECGYDHEWGEPYTAPEQIVDQAFFWTRDEAEFFMEEMVPSDGGQLRIVKEKLYRKYTDTWRRI